jgi:prolyl-tRNA editing enzyme YbaK/EbsC (Cys-tRNA(Pro) deacylase)
VFVDENALLHPVISISAGKRGLQILLDPERYVAAVHGTWAAIARPAAATPNAGERHPPQR